MRYIIPAIFIFISVCLAAPGTSFAFNNQFQFHMGGGSGEYQEGASEGDISVGLMGLDYRRFFSPLESTDSPYALREYLQHPSTFFIGMDAIGITGEDDTTTDETVESQGTFTVGGIFYLPSKTGLGAALESSGGRYEEKSGGAITYSEEYSTGTFVLSVNQYIGDSASIGADIEGASSETEDHLGNKTEYDESVLFIHAEGVINNMVFLGAGFGGGEREYDDSGGKYDIGRAMFRVGVYPNQKLGITLNAFSKVLERDSFKMTTSSSALAVDYYFNDHMHLTGTLGTAKVEHEGSSDEVKYSYLDFLFGFLY